MSRSPLEAASYTGRERTVLIALAIIGATAINGIFLYGVFVRPEWLLAALTNPVALVFIIEALVLMVLLAWLFARTGIGRISWVWFIVLALLGSLAFAIPVALLWRRRFTPRAGDPDPNTDRPRPS